MNDEELEAQLRGAAVSGAIVDDGFTERVMCRVRAERGTIDGRAALDALRERQTGLRRATHWHWLGAAAGAVVALAPIVAGGLPASLQAPQMLALVIAAAAAAFALAAPAWRDGAGA